MAGFFKCSTLFCEASLLSIWIPFNPHIMIGILLITSVGYVGGLTASVLLLFLVIWSYFNWRSGQHQHAEPPLPTHRPQSPRTWYQRVARFAYGSNATAIRCLNGRLAENATNLQVFVNCMGFMFSDMSVIPINAVIILRIRCPYLFCPVLDIQRIWFGQPAWIKGADRRQYLMTFLWSIAFMLGRRTMSSILPFQRHLGVHCMALGFSICVAAIVIFSNLNEHMDRIDQLVSYNILCATIGIAVPSHPSVILNAQELPPNNHTATGEHQRPRSMTELEV